MTKKCCQFESGHSLLCGNYKPDKTFEEYQKRLDPDKTFEELDAKIDEVLEPPIMGPGLGTAYTTWCKHCSIAPNPHEPLERCPEEKRWWEKVRWWRCFYFAYFTVGALILWQVPRYFPPVVDVDELAVFQLKARHCAMTTGLVAGAVDDRFMDREEVLGVYDRCIELD